ncbi:unnamed protein product [Effrenium voratum]|nr:unnamed protein product [Effrenium voratum]
MVRHVNLHISADVLRNPRGLGICVAALFVILGVLLSHLRMAFAESWDFGAAYVGWVLLGLVLHGAASRLELTQGCKLHLHHWYWAFLASHYAVFDCLLSSLAQAAFMGIYIHGAACFGLEPIYEPHAAPQIRAADLTAPVDKSMPKVSAARRVNTPRRE